MQFENVCIESMAYELPPKVWSSEDIEDKLTSLYDRLHLSHGRLELMTGIKNRRFWDKPILPSEASALAGAKVLSKSQINKNDIDLLIHAAVCRDRLEPASASYVHQHLNLSQNTQTFDVSNACLGFLNAMSLSASLIQNKQIRKAMIVAGENGRPLIENTLNILLNPQVDRSSIKPYFANLTIGAGAGAFILSHASLVRRNCPKLLHAIVETDTNHSELCKGDTTPEEGLAMETNSEQLLIAGINVAKRAWNKFKSETRWSESTPDNIICHQVGRTHQRKLYDALNLDLNKDYSTFSSLGNIGSVSLPLTLAMAQNKKVIKSGSHTALLGIGSGISCMMMALLM